MPLGNPLDAYIQAAQRRDQNRLQMNQDIAGIGQGLGQTFGSIGQMIGEQKKKDLLQKIVMAMQNQGAPQQGPQNAPQQGPQMPGQSFPPPASGMGGPPANNMDQLKPLLMQADPKGMMSAMEGQMFPPSQGPMTPLQESERQKNLAQAAKDAATDPAAALKEKQIEFQQKLAEMKAKADADRQMRELIAQLAISGRQNVAMQGNQVKAETANSKIPWYNFWSKPVNVPGQTQQSSGGPKITNVQVSQ